MDIKFEGGFNIAVKIPKSKYEQTVKFYREILKLDVSRTHQVRFGPNVIWLDCVDNYTHSETWLELRTPDVGEAVAHLQQHGIHPCDELEQLPEGFHWIQDPAGTVFVLAKKDGKYSPDV
jgi:predicted enzyme related to lactoylglutathione lyase